MTIFNSADDASSLLAALLEVSDDAIVATDLDAVITSWNPAATRLYGHAAEDVIGQSMALLLPDAHQDLLPSHYARIRAGHRVEMFETMRVTKDGRMLEVSATLSPVRDAVGAVVGAVSVTKDIRGQKRSDAAMEASQARWRALLDSAVDAIVLIDSRGRIEAFNLAAERLFGYTEDEVRGKNVNILMPSPFHEEHDGYLARYLRDGHARIIGTGREVIGRRHDGSTFPVHLAVGEMVSGGERKFTGILRDLTGRVVLEGQLREQAALARLGEMAAVIAHEVRNPLAGIRGAIQVIGSRLPAGGPEAGVTKEIVARIDALSELMKDLLLFSRPPQPNPAPVGVVELVAATVELFAADPAFVNVRVEIEGTAPPLLADAGLLKIVFVNLLMNAAHAMKARGTIVVSVGAGQGSCSIAVRDTGPGISPEVRAKMFTPFFTTKSRGTGLGLPTAKRLIEAHHGNISIECPPQGGTVVTVELPLQP